MRIGRKQAIADAGMTEKGGSTFFCCVVVDFSVSFVARPLGALLRNQWRAPDHVCANKSFVLLGPFWDQVSGHVWDAAIQMTT